MKELFQNRYFNKYLPLYIIILTLVVLLGSSYALLRSSHTSSEAYTMNVGLLEVNFFGTTNTLTINNMVPMTDEEGMEQNNNILNFTVKNTGQIKADYSVYIEETSTSPEFKSVIRYAVNKADSGYGNTLKLTDNMLYIDKDQTLDVGGTVNYKVKFWLDYDADSTYMNKTFTARIVITSRQYEQKGVTAQQLIQNIKTNNLKTNNGTPLNYITETNNFGTETDQTITYLSGCSKYYLDQEAEGCTVDNTIDFNYVWYSGRMWRITSFNETTNTIKLITDQPQTVIAWHDSSSAFEGSYMKQFLNDEFYDTLYQPTIFIDTNIKWDVTETSDESTKLSNPTITSNVGLINSYEYYQSYQKVGSNDKYDFGYLNIGQYWWLLNPYSASNVFRVNDSGNVGYVYSPINQIVVRPSINLLSGVRFTGSGTESNPYRLVRDKGIGNTNDILNTRQVGEYVKLKSGDNEAVFRIVIFENNSTKLIALDYVDGGNTTKTFATENSSGNGTIFGEGKTVDDTDNTTWYSYLKNIYITDLKTKYGSNMFTTGEYYLGINADNASDTTTYYNYRTSICTSTSDLSKNCTKSRSKTLEAGLLRYGEMFAAQNGIGRIAKTSTYNTKTMWLMTRRTASSVVFVRNYGDSGIASPTSERVGRPSINLASGVKILSGTGLPNDPYVVGL